MGANSVILRLLAAVLFAANTGLLFAVSDPAQAGAVLYSLPVALLAISDGRRGGALGTVVATALLAVWVVGDDIDLHFLGWFTRIATYMTIGVIVGHYAQLAATLERRRLDERYAGELHDRVIQSLVVARYQLTDDDEARPAVDEALQGAKEIISERLGEVEAGDLRLSAPRPPAAGGSAGA